MTERDRKVLIIVVSLVVLGGFWFLVVGKKRSAIKTAEAAQVTAQASLDQAKAAEAAAKTVAKVKPVAYSRLLRLGKAIPIDKDFESLLVQINDITVDADVAFESLTASSGASAEETKVGATGSTTCDVAPVAGASAATTAATAAPAAPATGATSGSTGSTAESFVGKDRDAAKGAVAASNGASTAAEEAASDAAACADSPTLTDIAATAAGLESESFGLVFSGSFYNLQDVFDGIFDLVKVNNGRVKVSGRLLDVNSIALAVTEFPKLTATVQMTGYKLPATAAAVEGASSGTVTPNAAPAPAAAASPPAGGAE